jgi:hypothetical protein
MTVYQRLYRRAEVLDRWANIYGGKRALADWARFDAAKLRLGAEIVKAWRLEEFVAWTDRQLAKNERLYAWLSR